MLIAIVALAVIAPLGEIGRVSAQDRDKDLREATFTAGEILDLAYQRKFNAMYDRIHPDAHAIIPRVAAVGVFEQLYATTEAGQGTVTGADLVELEWLDDRGDQFHERAPVGSCTL